MLQSPAVSFSLGALLGTLGGSVPRERYQDPTIHQNSNGSYYIRPWVDCLTQNGLSRVKKTIVLGPSEIGARGARAAKNAVMERINRASYVIQSQVRLGLVLDEYDVHHVRRQAYPTQNKYRSLIKVHIRPAFGDLQLCEITAKRVQAWLDAKAAFKSWSTRTDIRNVLSGIFEFARAHKYWQDENPMQYVTAGRKKLVREKVKLTDGQTRQLLAALPGQVRTLACVALFTTLRISECLGLREKHLDFAAGEISVEERFHRGDTDTVKTRKAERRVPMGYLADELQRLCLGDPERHLFEIHTRRGKSGASFVCRDDRALQRYFLRPAAESIGVYRAGFGWHALRREAVTAFNAALGVTQAMRLAGHATADMSAEYTLRDREAQDRAVRERQERLLGDTGLMRN